jgi:hypothetical protein
MTGALRRIRDADWLDAPRAVAYPRVLGAVTLLALLAMLLTANGVVDSRGEPLGADFSNFWSASQLALRGEPAAVYDMARQYAVQQKAFGAQTGFYPFFYPPTYLLSRWRLRPIWPRWRSGWPSPDTPIRRSSAASAGQRSALFPSSPFLPSSSLSATARTRC